MKLAMRILITALALLVGILLMPFTPLLFAYVVWNSEEEEL